VVNRLGAINLIPGPNSTKQAIRLGFDRARWRGLVAAGVCFILPAALIVTALAWAYVHYGETPAELLVLAVATLLLLWRTRLNSAWYVGAGALIGLARTLLDTVM